MNFLMPFTPNDAKSAESWLQWVIELGGCRAHDITLMPAKKIGNIDAMRDLAGAAFGSVYVLPDAEGIEGHPQGPNSCMRQAIWHCQVAGIGPWTFMEPDCIPLKTGWADEWEREYLAFAKPFMGEFRPAHDLTPDYLTGNMVLPKDALLLAPMLARRGLSIDGIELAFDIVAAKETLPHARLTKLLQQVPKNEDGTSRSFPDAKSLDILRPGAVLFHPCKNSTLQDRLRERMRGSKTLYERARDGEVEGVPPMLGTMGKTPTITPEMQKRFDDNVENGLDEIVDAAKRGELSALQLISKSRDAEIKELKAEISQLKALLKPMRRKKGVKMKQRTRTPEQIQAVKDKMAKARAARKPKVTA